MTSAWPWVSRLWADEAKAWKTSAQGQASILLTRADVRNAVTGASLNEVSYEMNRMATTSPTDEELNRAKRSLLGQEAILLQLRSATASVTFIRDHRPGEFLNSLRSPG